MIPTEPNQLPSDLQAFYAAIRHERWVEVASADVDRAQGLAEHGLGSPGDVRAGNRYWPVQVHPDAKVVRGHSGWIGSLYAEVSVCEAECRCGSIMPTHCGERIASLHGARLHMAGSGEAQVVVDGHQHCAEGGLFPRLAQVTLTDLVIGQVSGHFTRVTGLLDDIRWWTNQELAGSAFVCVSTSCVRGAAGPHVRVPCVAPLRSEFESLRGERVAVTAVSVALVDDAGRRPLERELNGTLPAGWKGPTLD